MSALPRPDLPPGPAQRLVEELHALHHRAGWPSLRTMAREVGCSHTTVSAAFSDARVPRWGLLELLVETLDGDPEEFHRLWLAATGDTSPAGVAAPPDEAVPVAHPASVVPHQLPAAVHGFVGRVAEQESLDRLSATAAGGAGAGVVLVHGPAGVGKTSLAVQWARRQAGRFPDGELFVDLRGYDVHAPLSAHQALAMLLRSLGAHGAAVPVTQDERAAAYRTLMADKRMVVLLDNAHAVEQVRDLLPGSVGSVVLVTSRSQLPGLVVRHGAVRLGVDLLPSADAVDLVRALVGERVDADAQAAATLVRQCASLPLALRIAAELVVARPGAGIGALVVELGEESERLSLLGVDQDYGAVRSVFSWSWRHLDADATRAFALLGGHPGHEISLGTASDLLGVPARLARATLGELVRASLLAEPSPDRFVAHDLLRQYAAEELAALPEEAQRTALSRLDASYLAAAARAVRALHGVSFRGARGLQPALDDPGDAAEAREWLEAETVNVVALALSSGPDRWPTPGILARVLSDYLDERGMFDDAMRLHAHARDIATRVDDVPRQADATDDLARVLRRLGSYDEADRLHQEALSTYRETGDEPGRATSLHRLGVLEWRRGRYRSASEHLREALDLFTGLGDSVGQGNAGYALAIALRRLGDYVGARARHQEALEVLRTVGDRRGEAAALNNLGMVLMLQGEHDLAGMSFAEALECHLDLRQPIGVAVAWDNLGSLANRRGRHDEALACHRTALSEFVRLGYPAGEADSRRGIGIALAGLGRVYEALDELSHAVEVGRSVGEADVEMNAWCEMGRVLLTTGRVDASESAYAEVVRLAESSGDRLLLAAAVAGLSDVHEARGDREAAAALRGSAETEFQEMGIAAPGRVPARDAGGAGSPTPFG